jgi:2-oxoglutarate dehydrogenase E1 component
MNVSSQSYLDELFQAYQQDPRSVSEEWQAWFRQLENQSDIVQSNGHAPVKPAPPGTSAFGDAVRQDRVDQLIRGFRVRGHLAAELDPLGRARGTNEELQAASYNLTEEDFSRVFSSATIDGDNTRTLEEIINLLRATYCRSIGAQFMHIDDHRVRNWLQSRMERTANRIALTRDQQMRILTRLTDAELFEEFTRKKHIGAKTFSLEGAESLIPLLDLVLEKAGQHEVSEVLIGMAHRGRLNVLANIMGKRARNIFWSFNDPDPRANLGRGDVLYHMGYSSNWKTGASKQIHLSLCFNPSHLEFVNPVAIGRCRSKQDRYGDPERARHMTVLIHGDAAFAGEGVVQETLNLSELEAYRTGGTLHVIVNNQLGFTTCPDQGRSTTYATDVAKMLQIPIFHVNGEDPEAVAQVVELSMEFRREFHRDVVIDMYCYRRLGHNESDEPRFTQPAMYEAIDRRKTVRDAYLDRLLKLNEISVADADRIAENRKATLEAEFEAARTGSYSPDIQTLGGVWNGYFGGPEPPETPDTGIELTRANELIQRLVAVPEGFSVYKRLVPVLQARAEMADGRRNVDWATAELLAFASLATEGHGVRLTGQDCERGTFSQRHSVLNDATSGRKHHLLHHLAADQAPVEIANSPLSEVAVLGFEYGYSLDQPNSLVLWEAQFGDFWNVAQVIVDQFISSAEDKWGRYCGLTMLLPHGFEGAGPEHCSARLERFLTLAAEHNIQVAIPTTAAQHFHLLRRQIKRRWRKPLIVLTPKSLLREAYVASPLDQFTSGGFRRLLDDPRREEIGAPRHVVLCSGKLGVDLLKHRDETGKLDFVIIRIEQLYPLPVRELNQVLESYPPGTPVLWAQEEPRNMGACAFMRLRWADHGFERFGPLSVVSRKESASPSTGSKNAHKLEHDELVEAIIAGPQKPAKDREPVTA